MPLSTNTLFHFTDSIDVLFKILEEGFWPKYSKETGWKGKGKPQFAIPMVSFCNIPLSQIGEHINYYGSYGIGVSMEWAVTMKNILPVFYITRNAIPDIYDVVGDDSNKKKRNKFRWLFFLTRIKPYKGWNWKKKGNGQTINDYFYYNEREWRYIPEELSEEQLCIDVRGKDKSYLDSYQQEMKGHSLIVPLQEIKYIILKSEDERINALKKINDLFADKYTQQELALLKSKIITCVQIENDF